MTSEDTMRILAGITGMVIAGEAIALVVGMHILSGSDNPWISRKNDLMLSLDLLAGAVLVSLPEMRVPGLPVSKCKTLPRLRRAPGP